MQSIKLMKICWNERETICKKRCLVPWWQKKKREKNIQKTKGEGLPVGLIASAAAPFLGEITKPLFKNFFGGRRRKR